MINRLKVMCISTYDLPWINSLDGNPLVSELTRSLKDKNIQDRIDVVTCKIKDFSSQKEFKSVVSDVDVIVSEPYIFENSTTAPVLFSSDLSLKFLQLSFAGCEPFMKAVEERKQTPSYPVARFAGKFGIHIAEYVLGQMISFERHFPDLLINQKTHKNNWDTRLLGYRRLRDLTIGILGLGDIGHEVAKYCKSFGMTVWGMTRSPVPVEKRVTYVDEYRLIDGLEELLAASDYVCNILPSTPQTIGLLDKDGFQSCANKKSVFINVGRGSIVGESILIEALKKKRLGGAILDVFIKEPLSSTSELWTLDNVIITPHVAALTLDDELADLLADQIHRYLTGKPLLHVVDCENGY